MDSPSSSCKRSHSPLFPAYSSYVNNSQTGDTKKEWLKNSSFKEVIKDTEDREQSLSEKNYSPKVEELNSLDEKDDSLAKEEMKCSKSKRLKKKHSHCEKVVEANRIENRDNCSLQNELNKLIFIEETGLSTERAYRVDVKRDVDNFIFGSLYQKHVALYKMKTKSPLGLSVKEQLFWPISSKHKKAKSFYRYFKSNVSKVPQNRQADETFYVMKENNFQELEYIPLKLIINESSVNEAHNMKTFDGISIDWKKSKAPCDDSKFTEFGSDTTAKSLVEQQICEKITLFNKQLRETPHDEQLWLDFVTFQDEVFKIQFCTKSGQSVESKNIEKKLAILDRAVELNPGSVKLAVAKLELSRDIMETEKLISSWDHLIFVHPQNIQAWHHYLMFVLSNITYFTTPRIMKLYTKCIKTFSSLHEGNFQSHQPSPDILEDMIDLFSQFCAVLQSCGYAERAVAMYQALIEFNLFMPSFIYSVPCNECISLFEPFWDSGVPRFGEENALGWSAAVEKKLKSFGEIVSSKSLNDEEDKILHEKFPEWQTWLEFEKLRESHYWLPWQPNTGLGETIEDCEDPERTVVYDDLSGILFRLPTEKAKFQLLSHFLMYLGIKIHLTKCSLYVERSRNIQIFLETFDNLSESLDDMFSIRQVENPLNLKVFPKSRDLSCFIDNVFKQAMRQFSIRYKNMLSLIWLKFLIEDAFKTSNKENLKKNIKNVKKVAKNMLKQNDNRNCLFLWKEYIYLEWLNGNEIEAEQMFETLLLTSTSNINGLEAQHALWYFIRSCIELFTGMVVLPGKLKASYNVKSNQKSVWVLSHVGSKEKYVTYSNLDTRRTLILKAITGYKTSFDHEVSNLSDKKETECVCLNPYMCPAVDCIACLAYLHYFTQGMTAASEVLDEGIKMIKSDKLKMPSGPYIVPRKHAEELLYVLYAQLLNFHTWNSVSPLTPLRSFLFKAVEKFPANACLLSFLVDVESASSVIGHMRRFFSKLLNNTSQLVPVTWLFTIIAEFKTYYSIQDSWTKSENKLSSNNFSIPPSCGMTWKIRSLFEKALHSHSSRHCVAIWRSYCKFEMLQGESSKAKIVFHRALQCCPWSKILYMDAVEYFPEDLQTILAMMTEKLLRIRTPLEEVSMLLQHAEKNA